MQQIIGVYKFDAVHQSRNIIIDYHCIGIPFIVLAKDGNSQEAFPALRK